eukprot:13523046-Alexandrium_andersonii.AAC.2
MHSFHQYTRLPNAVTAARDQRPIFFRYWCASSSPSTSGTRLAAAGSSSSSGQLPARPSSLGCSTWDYKARALCDAAG